MISLICYDEQFWEYASLLRLLYTIPFRWTIPNDENRAVDGLDLREKYFKEHHKKPTNIMVNDSDKCTVLEMLIGLACRVEYLLGDSQYGDNPHDWFWNIIFMMGLGDATEDDWDEDVAIKIIDNMMDRGYNPDGSGGGLFVVDNASIDFTKIEIWQQLSYFINSLEEGDY